MTETRNLPAVRRSPGRAPARRRATSPVRADARPNTPAARIEAGRGDLEFLPSRLEVVETPTSPIRARVVLVLCAMFAAALAWGYFGRLSAYATAAGKIQTTGRTKVVEPAARGQVTKILVRDGDKVARGQVLVELDPTDARATRTIIADKLVGLRADVLRWRAENAAARADPVATSPSVAWGDDLPVAVREREQTLLRADLSQLAATLSDLANQRHAKEAARDKYAASIAAQKALVAVTSENSGMVETLQKQGWNSKAKLLDVTARLRDQQVALTSFEGSLADAQAAIPTIDSEIAKTRESFVTANTQQLASAERQINDLVQQLAKADNDLANMTLKAPVSGTIHASALTTIGQVVKPGQQLLEVVPNGGPLEIEAYVRNTDIGFVKVGQDAVIKVDTFNYGTYGSVPGKVTRVASDSVNMVQKAVVQDASLDGAYAQSSVAQKTGSLAFPITVQASQSSMNINGKEIALSPGMSVSIEVETERRRAIDYIISPIEELFSTAAHER